MAKTTILVSLALFSCWMALTTLVHCAGEETNNVEDKDKKKSDSSHAEAPLNIAKEKKKLSKEVRSLRDTTQKQMDKLKENIKRMEDDIWKIVKKEQVLKMDAKELAEIQQATEEILKSLGMEVQQPAELSVGHARKTIEEIKAKCTAEIDNITVQRDQLRAELDVQVAKLTAAAKARLVGEMAATRKVLEENVEKFVRQGGKIEDLAKGMIGSNQPNAELHNKIVKLKSDLNMFTRESTNFNIFHEHCANERAQIDVAYNLFVDKMEKLNSQPFGEHLAKIKFLEGKMYWLEKNKNLTLPTPQELQAVEEMQSELKVRKAELKQFERREYLEIVLKELIDCLDMPVAPLCKKRREEVERLAQQVAQHDKNGSRAEKEKGARKPSLMESIGKVFGAHGHSKTELSTCVEQVVAVYERAALEARNKMRDDYVV